MSVKSIQSTLKKWLDENKGFQQRYESMKTEILKDKAVEQFLLDHPDITEIAIEKRLNKLYEYVSQSKQCDRCDCLSNCNNIVKGYSPILQWIDGEIHIAYEKCHQLIENEKNLSTQNLVKSLYMPKEILQATISDLHYDGHRKRAFFETNKFLDDAQQSLPQKGIYFSGPFGVGKTYFLGAIANRLQQLGFSSTLIYMPEFVQQMREAIKYNTVQEKLDEFKYADVIMFDDIGAETMSAWFRDEILGSILQYRMMEQLPVFFTSNYTMDQLEKILATSTKGDIEEVKAGRIMERIKQVSKEVGLSGHNRRE